MAKVTITIEDMPNGKIQIISTPNFMQMVKLTENGIGLTDAEGYAVALLNHARKISKSQTPDNKIYIPRIGR